MKKLLAITLAMVLMLTLGAGAALAAVGGAWASKATHPVGIEGAAASTIGGKIYVSHGMRGGTDTATLTVYDIASDTWSTGASASVARAELVGAAAGGKHYAIGGRPAQTTVEVYDPATDTWSLGPAMPTARRGLGAATIGNLIYVVGGSTGSAPHSGTALAANEVLNTTAGTWTSLASMPIPMMDVYATVAFGGKVYVFGGYDGTSVSGAVQIYDPSAGTWSSGAPMPTPRSNAIAGVVCGQRIFVIGGYNGTTNLAVNEVYDPATNTWDTAPAKPTAGSEFAVGDVSVGGKIYVIGSGIFGAQQNTHEVFSCVLQVDKELTEGPWQVELYTDEEWELTITVTNNDASTTMTGVVVQDNLGGDLELLEVNGETVTQPTSKKDSWADSTGDVTVMWTGKTLKAHITWTIGDLAPMDSETLTLLVSTDMNTGHGNSNNLKFPNGHQEYTEPGIHCLNSGATATGMLGDWELIVKSIPICVEAVEPIVD